MGEAVFVGVLLSELLDGLLLSANIRSGGPWLLSATHFYLQAMRPVGHSTCLAFGDLEHMSGSLEQKVLKWLSGHGYPLEMEVASLARVAGFDVSQSDYYLDPDTKEPREIDLVLSVHDQQGQFRLSYNLLVECKSSRDKPWLLLCTPNEIGAQLSDDNPTKFFEVHLGLVADRLGSALLLESTINGSVSRIFPRLNTEPLLGYGMTQAFAEAGDAPYKAMMSATKAALSLVGRGTGVIPPEIHRCQK